MIEGMTTKPVPPLVLDDCIYMCDELSEEQERRESIDVLSDEKLSVDAA